MIIWKWVGIRRCKMKRWCYLLIFAFLFSSLPAEEGKNIISVLQEKGYSLHSYRCKFVMLGKVKPLPPKTEGKVLFEEGKGLFVETVFMFENGVKGEKLLRITDKEFITYDSLSNQAIKIDLEKVKAKVGDKYPFINPLGRHDLRNPFILKGLEPDTVKLEGEDKTHYIFTAVMYPDPSLGIAVKAYTAKLWVDKNSGLLKKLEVREGKKVIYTMEFLNFETNITIPEEEFLRKLPENAQILDITESWLKKE